jgi:membrane fusion protein, multidrug efflux system
MPPIRHPAAAASLCAVACILGACGDGPAANTASIEDAPTPVVTQRVELQPMVDKIEALGTATANESVEIRPRIASLVEEIAFAGGQQVRKGDLLIQLEDDETVAGLALAQASLSESRSLYNRSKSLADTKAISASTLEQLLAQVKVNEAQVQAANARLDNTSIRAPFAGRIGLRRVSPGSFVDTTTVITTLDDISRIKLDFSVPETFLTALSVGMNISAHSPVYPDRVFTGTVANIDTRVDPVTRAIQVRAIIPNPDEVLKPGMFLSVDLERDRGDVLMAPEQAIVPEGDVQYVFVVDNGVAKKRAVELGRRIPGFVAIENGLSAGEAVITEGTNKVRDGSKVRTPGASSAAAGLVMDGG